MYVWYNIHRVVAYMFHDSDTRFCQAEYACSAVNTLFHVYLDNSYYGGFASFPKKVYSVLQGVCIKWICFPRKVLPRFVKLSLVS